MNITGKCTVYVKEKEINGENRKFYSLGLSKKDGDSWKNFYIPANFKKGVVVENKTKIDITNGWLDCYTNKDGQNVLTAFVSEFTSESNKSAVPDGWDIVQDKENLPF